MSEAKKQGNNTSFFNTLNTLIQRKKDGTFGEIIDDWKWILGYSAHYKWTIILYTLLGIFSTTMGLVSSVASKYVIDIITGYQYEKLSLMIAIMLGSAAFSLVFRSLISRLNARISIRINQEIEADIFAKIIESDWMAIGKYEAGDILHRFRGDISTVSSNAVSWVPNIVIAVYNFLATFLVIWHYSKMMALLSFLSAPVMLLMSKFLIRKQREYKRKREEMASKVMGFEVETFYNMDTIKSFGITDLYIKKLHSWQEKYRKILLEHNMFTIKTNVFMNVLGSVVQYIAFGYCLWLLWTNQITYGTMTLFLTQRSRLAGAFESVVGIVPTFLNSSVSANRIRELAELPKEKHSEVKGEVSDSYEVVMENVEFSYADQKEVIKNSSIHVKPGEIIALIGPSGEGKTTMLRLILGLVHPDQGTLYLKASDGRKIECGIDSRYLFSYVPQGNTMLSGSIADNMRMAKEDASDEEIMEALKTACAWEFVDALPDGINSSVREKGRGLSEGQAQRIAIARALLRDAPIVLLDEATSALDVTTERKVLENIMLRDPNKTVIVTTHRPTVLNLCNRIYRVMDNQVKELSAEESGKMVMDF